MLDEDLVRWESHLAARDGQEGAMFDIASGREGGLARHGGIYSSSDYMRFG